MARAGPASAGKPLVHLTALNAKTDVRVKRRALSQDELAQLIAVTELSRDAFRGLAGRDRAMLYRTAALTGLRASELASLRIASFDFTVEPPTVTLEAAYSKHRRKDVLPLHAELAAALREWLHGGRQTAEKAFVSLAGSPEAKPWPGTWLARAADMLRTDLGAWIKEAKTDAERQTACGLHIFAKSMVRVGWWTSMAYGTPSSATWRPASEDR